nr:NADH dehydrogenase subunit 5 [Bostrychia moritziana]
MYLSIVFLPFFSSLISGFGGRWLGYYGSSLTSTFFVGLSFLLSCFVFFEVGLNQQVVYINLFTWFFSDYIFVCWDFLFDSITSVMLIVVTSISFLVHIYSIDYMKSDPHFPRFCSFLSIFTFFMLLLVTSNNLVQLFLGWEGVGLASYLLVNFWFTRLSANKAAIKALVVNRVGDFGLLMTIFLLFFVFNSVDFDVIFSTVPFFTLYSFWILNFEISFLSVIGIFIVIGAVGKSAQLGLHTWLPDAMEGPTPVSALIHAATMVTAGVFLLVRFSPLIEFSPFTLFLLIILGSFTAFFAALVGSFQQDLKKVVAYSTCSQLGYMVFCCGLSCYNVSLFHLFNHAFFKALLFLGAGSVIHAISNEQDMRRMGGFRSFIPITYSVILIASLALVGFPFLSGFYSKDVILEIANVHRNPNLSSLNVISLVSWFGLLAVFFTAFYSTRIIFLTFINSTNTSKKLLLNVHEPSYFIILPLICLTLGTIFIGYLTKDFFIGLGTDFWNTSIFLSPITNFVIESEFLITKLKWLPFLFTIFGILLAFASNFFTFNFKKQFFTFNSFLFLLNKKWYFDLIYNRIFVFPLLSFGFFVSFKNLDRGFIEILGPKGTTSLVNKISIYLSNIQTGQIAHYIFYLMLALGSIIWFSTSNYIYYKNLNELFFIFFILVFYI